MSRMFPVLFGAFVALLPVFGGRLPADVVANDKSVSEKPAAESPAIEWLSDYGKAARTAKREGKMLLVYFCTPGGDAPCNRFQATTLSDPQVRKRMARYVCVQVCLNATIPVQVGGESRQIRLIEHNVFNEMLGRPGIAMIDYAHSDAPYYKRVVSTFPITDRLWYTPEQMKVILDLPPGTLTQRTLIYAVRIHPERPRSTEGTLCSNLTEEAAEHSQHQARILRQGHHAWDTRFQRITRRLPGGLVASEVCAESWPGERLVEAAIECVRSWRSSSGHWGAVRAPHDLFGYDMKLGSNGIWYATGIFGQRR